MHHRRRLGTVALSGGCFQREVPPNDGPGARPSGGRGAGGRAGRS